MQVQVVRLPDYVDVEMTGHAELQAIMEVIRKVGSATHTSGDARVLFDLLSLEGEVHSTGQMQVGEQVVRCLAHLQKVASVVPADKITRTSEKVARSQGVRLKVFDSKDAAIAWLREADSVPAEGSRRETQTMDPVRAAIWEAVRHLFPPHARSIQFPNGTLAISWNIANQPDAIYDMATPITIRLEPDLVEHMRMATPEQRKRIAAHQEAAFRAGLVGYDPFTDVPRARVIVLGM